jgi:PAS domain S-box-containing protein
MVPILHIKPMISNQPTLEKDSLVHYQQIFEESPVPKYIFDLETFFFLAVNKASLLQYGYTREEFLSMKITDLRPADEEKARPLKEALTRNPDVTYADYGQGKHKRKNGEVFYVHVYAHTTRFMGKDAHFTMAIDIDQKVKAQQKIEKDEQNLRAIINNTTDLIWSIDRNFDIISGNEIFYQRMELITGKRIDQINHDDFPSETQQKWIEYYERGFRGESFKVIWHEQLPGLDLYEEISLTPIVDTEGNVQGLSCISRDITENYLYTKRIEAQNEQLRKIAWIQSHEVRAPLSDIMGLVSLVRGAIVPADEQATIISLISDAANNLNTVIARIVEEAHRNDDQVS